MEDIVFYLMVVPKKCTSIFKNIYIFVKIIVKEQILSSIESFIIREISFYEEFNKKFIQQINNQILK